MSDIKELYYPLVSFINQFDIIVLWYDFYWRVGFPLILDLDSYKLMERCAEDIKTLKTGFLLDFKSNPKEIS